MNLLRPKQMVVGNSQERFLSPCYEQLRGAFYALDQADQNEFDSRPSLDVTKLDESQADQKAWLAGFYFNSAVHRIAWATDRLLELFCYLPRESGQSLELYEWQTSIGELRKVAGARLKEQAFSGCKGVKAALACLQPVDLWVNPVQPSNYLSVIRERVNVQKHAYEGFPYVARPAANPGTWEHLPDGDREKMKWIRLAAALLADVYHDLHKLYFDDPRVLHPPKTFNLRRR